MPSRHRVHLLNCYDESTAATKIRRRALRRRDGGGRRTRQKLAKLQWDAEHPSQVRSQA
jgi:hypothetical protein